MSKPAILCFLALYPLHTTFLPAMEPVPLRVLDVTPDEVTNSLLTNKEGWIGADGVNSVILPDQSILWIFGDTLIGTIRDGKRHDLAMVNNTFAKQQGWGTDARFQFYVHRDAQSKPTSFIKPQSKPGYFWLWDGLVDGEKLYIFTTRMTSPGTITAFDWKLMDQSLLVVDNPQDEPARWKVQQIDLPFGVFGDDYEALWGLEVLRIEGDIYVYGTTQRGKGSPRSLVVAKVKADEITDFSRWKFMNDREWRSEAREASGLAPGVGTEGSITWLPNHKRYIYVYSPPLDPRIQMRTAASPTGPWSEAVTIYTCPEVRWDPRIFCYAGKARLVPGSNNELSISYATNSFEMLPHVLADARVYQPRFVKGRLAD